MKAALQTKTVETFKKLNEILSAFPQEKLNITPFEGSWTGGQTVRHIILASKDIPKLFAGNTENTTRKPDENTPILDSIFLDFNKKYESPLNIKPEEREYDKNVQLSKLSKIEKDLLEAAENDDLSLLCLDANVPGLEKFTIYEWIYFALVHTQRHTKQLNDIAEHLK